VSPRLFVALDVPRRPGVLTVAIVPDDGCTRYEALAPHATAGQGLVRPEQAFCPRHRGDSAQSCDEAVLPRHRTPI
jgi:hypothetical protein